MLQCESTLLQDEVSLFQVGHECGLSIHCFRMRLHCSRVVTNAPR
jgi:hypothetical protein